MRLLLAKSGPRGGNEEGAKWLDGRSSKGRKISTTAMFLQLSTAENSPRANLMASDSNFVTRTSR